MVGLIPELPRKDTGLPSSAWITDGVRPCLFAGGITFHVAGTAEPANYARYRFGHSVPLSFAVYTSRHFNGSSNMLTIPMTPPHLILVRNRHSSQNQLTDNIVRIASHKLVTRNVRIQLMEHKVWSFMECQTVIKATSCRTTVIPIPGINSERLNLS